MFHLGLLKKTEERKLPEAKPVTMGMSDTVPRGGGGSWGGALVNLAEMLLCQGGGGGGGGGTSPDLSDRARRGMLLKEAPVLELKKQHAPSVSRALSFLFYLFKVFEVMKG